MAIKKNTKRTLLYVLALLAVCALFTGCKGKVEPVRYTVTFLDFDSTVLNIQKVKDGEEAIPPEEPQREGYRFVGWNKDFSAVHEDMSVSAEYCLETEVIFKVSDITASTGLDNATVSVSVKNNPGILGMVFSVKYDETAMTLVDCKSGNAVSALSFQPPSSYESGCNFVWYGSETGDVADGELLQLVFSLPEGIPAGTYPVTISCDVRDIYDANCDILDPEMIPGSITVTQ